MSSDQPKVIFNTRERALSSDQNLQVQYSDRALQEALRHLGGDASSSSGVIQGLECTIGSGMNVDVSPGLALLRDATKVFPDSLHRWVELLAQESVTLSDGDGSNPRWDVIEIQAGTTVTSTVPRDIFQPSLGTFTTVNTNKLETSTPTLRAREGTPAATPVLPSGAAGWIPLAYVKVPAGETDLGTNAPNNVVRCRPILRPFGPVFFSGGGVDGDGSTAGVVARQFRGRLPGSAVTMLSQNSSGSFNPSLSTNAMFDSGTTFPPAGLDLMYVYACEPPYPSGYDANLAPRELLSLTDGLIPSVPDADIENCVIAVSDTSPFAILTNAEQQGARSGSNFSLNDPTWGTAIDISRTMYVGTLVATSGGAFQFQRVNGAWVDVLVADHDETDSANGGANSGTGNIRVANPLSDTGNVIIPTFTERFKVSVFHSVDATSLGRATIEDRRSGAADLWASDLDDSGADIARSATVIDLLGDSGEFDWTNEESGGGTFGSLTVGAAAYLDGILAAR